MTFLALLDLGVTAALVGFCGLAVLAALGNLGLRIGC